MKRIIFIKGLVIWLNFCSQSGHLLKYGLFLLIINRLRISRKRWLIMKLSEHWPISWRNLDHQDKSPLELLHALEGWALRIAALLRVSYHLNKRREKAQRHPLYAPEDWVWRVPNVLKRMVYWWRLKMEVRIRLWHSRSVAQFKVQKQSLEFLMASAMVLLHWRWTILRLLPEVLEVQVIWMVPKFLAFSCQRHLNHQSVSEMTSRIKCKALRCFPPMPRHPIWSVQQVEKGLE